MGIGETWHQIIKKINRLLEKGVYIGLGVIMFFASLFTFYLTNCVYRLATYSEGPNFELALRCFTGHNFPLWIFAVSLCIGLVTIFITFYTVGKQQQSTAPSRDG